MAKITASVYTSHVPAIGAALDLGKTGEPYWKPLFAGYEPSKAWLENNKPDVVWVRQQNGALLEVRSPRLFADTLSGRAANAGPDADPLWLPLSNLAEVRVRKLDRTRTVLLAGAVVGVGIAAVVRLSGSGPTVVFTPEDALLGRLIRR